MDRPEGKEGARPASFIAKSRRPPAEIAVVVVAVWWRWDGAA